MDLPALQPLPATSYVYADSTHDPALDESRPEMRSLKIRQMT